MNDFGAASLVKREMRGIRFELPALFHEAAPEEIVDNVASAHFNAILVSVSTPELTDPRFMEMVGLAHARDIEVHAVLSTIVPGEVGTSSRTPDPEAHAVNSSGEIDANWLCPMKACVQAWVLELATGMTRLGVDGLELDYIRFGPIDLCYCDVCQRLSRQWLDAHAGCSREDWRDSAISGLIAKVRTAIKDIRPEVIFSCSTWTVGAGQKRTMLSATGEGYGWRQGQDFMQFREQVDFLRPMLYSALLHLPADWVVDMTELAVKNAAGKTKIIPGLILWPGLEPGDTTRIYPQVLAAGGGGMVFYSYRNLFGRQATPAFLDEIRCLFA